MTPSDLVRLALQEESSKNRFSLEQNLNPTWMAHSRIKAHEDIVLSGSETFETVFNQLDPNIQIKWCFKRGQMVWKDQILAHLKGPLISLMKGESTALAFLGKLSGIASLTRCYVQQTEHTGCKILESRHTLPLWSPLDQESFVHGGGHLRSHLPESVWIRPHQVKACGGLHATLQKIRQFSSLPLSLECEKLDGVQEAVKFQEIKCISLDNMTEAELKEALNIIPRHIKKEVKGVMDLQQVRKLAEMGYDFISLDNIMDSAPSAQISMELQI